VGPAVTSAHQQHEEQEGGDVPPLEAEENYAPQQDQDWDDNLPNLRLVYSRLRFESCPREPEMVDCHNRGQLLPLQLPTHSLPEDVPFTSRLIVLDSLTIKAEGQIKVAYLP
jgi:hypothetical protein